MQITVVAFAGLRELIGQADADLTLPAGARACDAWRKLEGRVPELASHRESVRIARNGRLAANDDILQDGDEIALLPPVGGG